MAKFINRWLPAILIMVAIFYFSSIPSKEMPNFGSWDVLFKKSGHMLGYAMLAVAYLRGINLLSLKSTAIVLLLLVLYALSDEFHQSFVAGRTSTLMDVGIDTIGGSLGLALIAQARSLRKYIFLELSH